MGSTRGYSVGALPWSTRALPEAGWKGFVGLGGMDAEDRACFRGALEEDRNQDLAGAGSGAGASSSGERSVSRGTVIACSRAVLKASASFA